jgi:hypothetical protein
LEWIGYIASLSGSGPYSVSTSEYVTSFSPFAVGNEGALPVQMLYFNSLLKARVIKLSWATAWEINNRGFDVERRTVNPAGAEQWSPIGFVEGKGTTNSQQNYSYEDSHLNTGIYQYRLKQIDYNGHFEYFELQNSVAVGVPKSYSISQNYPNPSNPVSKLDYSIPQKSFVSIKVYDLLGREVLTLADGYQDAGYHTAEFDGSKLASGVYIYRFSAAEFPGQVSYTQTMKLVLVK